jgi:PKD repeat protein
MALSAEGGAMKRNLAVLCLVLAGCALAACSVYLGNIRPIASFIANPTSGPSPLDVDFDASASHDPDGTIDAYEWSFGDGQTASAVVTPSHQYTVQTDPETFAVVLTVTDNLGATDTAVQEITVNP